MKKTILLLVSLVLITAILAGCSGGKKDEPNQEEREPITPVQGERLSESYVNVFDSGKYYMKYKLISGGSGEVSADEPDAIYKIYISGDKMSNITEIGEQKLQNIVTDDKMFIIMHEQKMIIATEVPENIRLNTGVVETKGMVYRDTGNTQFVGKTCVYEEFLGADGYTGLRFIFDNNQLIGLQVRKTNDQSGYELEILEISGAVTVRDFDLPNDYAIVN